MADNVTRTILAAALVLTAWGGALGQSAGAPISTICQPGYARAQRLPANEYYRLAKAVYAAHGIAWEDRHAYQLDHLRPLCLGGSNDPSNLRPQPLADADRKDDLEWYACKAACAGAVPYDEAVSWFRDDAAWETAYSRIHPPRSHGDHTE